MASTSKSEQSYVQASLLAPSPFREDGRGLLDYRHIALETGVAPLANGSARISIGDGPHGIGGGIPGTEVLAAVKLEVEDVQTEEGVDVGRVVCSVSCSPSAYPNLTNNALDDLQSDLSSVLQQTLSHRSLHPPNLSILAGRKSWLLHLDVVVLTDSGNIYDALFLASAAALRDTRVPRTRGIEYKAQNSRATEEDVPMGDAGRSGFDTRALKKSTDFELTDYWDEGEPLGKSESWPVCITLNLLPPIHYLDATPLEESATMSRLLLFFAFPNSSSGNSVLQGMRLLGPGETDLQIMKTLIPLGEKYARDLKRGLDAKFHSEALRRNPATRNKMAR
ncbi:ribosomal protein S5 domain 2-like protein [Rickenella mellea]|uniref:Ribosomal RNA-processing protein 42 n=1 Tax=Rickenella mellea TaxID=50990 RepID=A0A4Y7PRE9_9AGAM|nr:ribosomal protein S5 domain 2-like protein [Rickenella mellea]